MPFSLFDRRRFVAAAAAVAAVPSALFSQESGVRLMLDTKKPGTHTMPKDYVGLSYELQQLSDPSFFSPENLGLIREFRAMSPHGVLRLGGNTSEFAWWKATPTSVQPERRKTQTVAGEPTADTSYGVTPRAVDNLAGFLRATGWTCLYGMNLGTNTPALATAEATYVAKALGSRLQYFQIGNEVDLFDRHLRDPKTWSVKAYLDEWTAIARAVTAAVPDAKFGIPDVASDVNWLTKVADLWLTVQNPPHVTTLSHHYYFGGPATDPNVNIERLMKANLKVAHNAEIASAAAQKMGVRVRMTEGNTCYRGGKPGVSDVFAAALWAADYSLLLASYGYSGVNLHGGTGKSVANSVGGFLPGDVMLKDAGANEEQIQTHPHPFYTPIGTFGMEYATQPVGVGLKFAGEFAGATLQPIEFNPGSVNATAYAAKMPSGHYSIIVLNKDAAQDLQLTLNIPGASGAVITETLHAPALDSREATISHSGSLPRLKRGKYKVTVPKASGMRLTVA